MELPSRYLREAVEQLSTLPGIGKRTALRLVLDILKRPEDEVARFSNAFMTLKSEVKTCQKCGNLSDSIICSICADPKRDHQTVCVVEDLRDILAIEATTMYNGVYHVLGGVISPMDGIGPEELNISALLDKIKTDAVNEVILALNTSMEGDTTNFYLYKKIQPFNIKVTTITRGISVGAELHYADEISLGRSLSQRIPFETTFEF
ncbi:MAG: recombination protein RecR [Crocinitomicaceae bacterium]|nr:recombination protein RecR [Crocinitomicaceae bacterium]